MSAQALYAAQVRERQRMYLLGICHEVPVYPELARKAWRIDGP